MVRPPAEGVDRGGDLVLVGDVARQLEDSLASGGEFLLRRDALVEIAHDLGLHKNEVMALHLSSLRNLACEAWADQVVTDEERNDLLTVATLLALDPAIVETILGEERDAVAVPAPGQERRLSRSPACR